MKKTALLALLVAASCSLPPELLPPPFGPTDAFKGRTRLFYPTGIAVTSGGAMLIANGNFNHAYDGGTLVSLPASFIGSVFNQTGAAGTRLSCDVAPDPVTRKPPAGCEQEIPALAPAVMIGNYAGPLALNDAGTIVYTASRDTGILNAVSVAGGALSCASGAGTSATDCRKGMIDLKTAAKLDGPYAIVPGNVLAGGSGGTQSPVFFVTSVVPHIEGTSSGLLSVSSQIAALPMGDPSQVAFTMTISPTSPAATSTGPMVFDPVKRRLYLAGCYERFSGTGAGEPGSGRCSLISSNLLRIFDVDSQSAAQVQVYDLYADVLSIDTTQLMLADPDPVTGAFTTLWATMRNPDILVQIALPTQFSTAPRVRRAVPMPISPADMIRIPRPGGSDLIGVVSERSGSIAFYDVGLDQVVGQVEHLGDSPFSVVQVPCPSTGLDFSGSACLATTVFGECRVAFIEVPLAQPWNALLRGRAGSCP